MKEKLTVILPIFCSLLVSSCIQNSKPESAEEGVKAMPKKTIHVYFFEGFNQSLGENTLKELTNTFDSVVFEGLICYPDSAYYKPRARHKADKIVKHLRNLQGTSTDLVIGFASKDISDKVHNYDDFGVMGWTRYSLHSSVVSTYRLKDKNRWNEDFTKLVLHELGHSDGLPHCKKHNACYMRDANKQNLFPELDGFCDNCAKHLVKNGWHFK